MFAFNTRYEKNIDNTRVTWTPYLNIIHQDLDFLFGTKVNLCNQIFGQSASITGIFYVNLLESDKPNSKEAAGSAEVCCSWVASDSPHSLPPKQAANGP